MPVINKRFISGVMTLISLVLTFILVRIMLRSKLTEQGFWIKYLGFGILLEVSYLSTYFLLKTLLFRKPHLIRVYSQIVGATVAFLLTLLAGLLSFIVISAMIATGKEIFAYLIDLLIIILGLGFPAFFLWRQARNALWGEPNNSFNRTRN
jgi:hypothetical protein